MKEQQLKIVRVIESELEKEVKEIAVRISLIAMTEGKFYHPNEITGLGLSVIAELIMRERLIIKTRRDI